MIFSRRRGRAVGSSACRGSGGWPPRSPRGRGDGGSQARGGPGVPPPSHVAGVAQPYGRSDRVPIHERFFAGGSYSIRGFGDKRLGPKDPGGTPQGGEALLVVS